jgi:predicted secreted protein
MTVRQRITRKIIPTIVVIVPCGCAVCGKTILPDESDNDTNLVLNVGDTISIKVRSNCTTGYSWSPGDLPGFLELLESKDESGKNGKEGQLGFQSFTFKATKADESVLFLHHSRPFEKDKPAAERFRIWFSSYYRPMPSAYESDLLSRGTFSCNTA